MNRHVAFRGYGVSAGTWAAAAFAFLFLVYLALPTQQVFASGGSETPPGKEQQIFSAGNLTISAPVPSGASSSGVAVKRAPGAQVKNPPKPTDLSWRVILANVIAGGSETQPAGKNLTFKKHITITVTYSVQMEDKYGTPLQNLRFLFWDPDPSINNWVEVSKNDRQGKKSPSYQIGPLRVNKAHRTISVTVMEWPLGDPCVAFGG